MEWYEKFAIAFLVFGALLTVYRGIVIPIKYNLVEDHECIATVTDKERHEDGYYLIFGTDLKGNTIVLKNGDTVLRGKYDSSNMYQKIEENKTYKFHLNGYRSEFWSLYENILSFEEYAVSKNETTEETNAAAYDNEPIDTKEVKLSITPEVTEQTQSPYYMHIQFESQEGISMKKLYKPEISNELDVADDTTIKNTIIANGIDIFGTSFEVSENGVYWIYIQDISGKEYTQRFIVENIY